MSNLLEQFDLSKSRPVDAILSFASLSELNLKEFKMNGHRSTFHNRLFDSQV